jgi:hypothetical protein
MPQPVPGLPGGQVPRRRRNFLQLRGGAAPTFPWRRWRQINESAVGVAVALSLGAVLL